MMAGDRVARNRCCGESQGPNWSVRQRKDRLDLEGIMMAV